MPIGRVGRPGLVGTMARTAVIAGTAQMTSNAVNRRASNRMARAQGYAAPPQQQGYAAPPQEVPAPPSPAEAPADDLVAQITELAKLHAAGILTDEEFAAAKAKLVS